MKNMELSLGKPTTYEFNYNPELLERVPRSWARESIGIPASLPFSGFDIWNAYEFSWLSPSGKPEIAIIELWIPCETEFLVESKSLKLYLNSFNNSIFENEAQVIDKLKYDLDSLLETSLTLQLTHLGQWTQTPLAPIQNYQHLDLLSINTKQYDIAPQLLRAKEGPKQKQAYYSDLLRSRCPVTGQPDWATIFIEGSGCLIDQESLLAYIISFRNSQEFHETCVEKIFTDLQNTFNWEELFVHACFTRRGGIDINPARYNTKVALKNFRTHRQ